MQVFTARYVHVLPLPEVRPEWEDGADLIGWTKRDLRESALTALKAAGAHPEKREPNFWRRARTELLDIRGWRNRREARR
jgi:hypothetical protein